jgi:hypothetical protein
MTPESDMARMRTLPFCPVDLVVNVFRSDAGGGPLLQDPSSEPRKALTRRSRTRSLARSMASQQLGRASGLSPAFTYLWFTP